MRGHWSAPFRDEWRDWAWPCEMSFDEVWSPLDLLSVAPDIHVYYANPNAAFVLGGDIKNKFPNLSLVVTPSTGETHLDRVSLRSRHVAVLSLRDDLEALSKIRASSEFTFLMILNALRRIDAAILEDNWGRDEDDLRGQELYGKMVGLIGHGRIGKNLETWLRAFGAGVYWNDPEQGTNVYCPSVEWMFRNCRIVVICCSMNRTSLGMVKPGLVRLMRQGAFLINTARGEIVDDGVGMVLAARPDLTYWTDVLSGEAGGDILRSPFLGLPNVHVTPHIAGTTFESQEKAARIALSLSKRYLDAHR